MLLYILFPYFLGLIIGMKSQLGFHVSQKKSSSKFDFKQKNSVTKPKKILLRVSENLYEGIDKAISLGIADNASEFVRRCVVNQLLDLKLLGLAEKER